MICFGRVKSLLLVNAFLTYLQLHQVSDKFSSEMINTIILCFCNVISTPHNHFSVLYINIKMQMLKTYESKTACSNNIFQFLTGGGGRQIQIHYNGHKTIIVVAVSEIFVDDRFHRHSKDRA